ncbi:CbtA family protein [Gordonia sp. SL306]|uniref:CbtA family protein n=1 Tax=Gordonia sp. SL306 TaxID=2995145 RepID=UPI00226DEA1F|nr:CbtA family protein [Gordonia sp. SL306]WAC54807.1 CbtA family protein [Gordonia sp. SL306]
MEKKFIGAGLLSGLIAGIVAYVFARLFIEPQVAAAIDYEEGRSHAEEMLAGDHGAHEHGEVFTRSIQENIGAGVGTVVFAVCMGAFFAVAFTILWAYIGRHFPATDPRMVAAALGVIGFVAVFGVPFFAYPANPPAVGNDDTIGARSGAFLTITLLSLAFAIAAVVLALWLRPRLGGLLSGVAATVGYLVAVTITVAVLPEFDEVPGPVANDSGQIMFPGFPGDVIGDFRVYTIANQVVLWTVLTVVFAVILGRLARPAVTPDATTGDKIVAEQG